MKKIMLIIVLFSLVTIIKAEEPPATYQRLKCEMLSLKVEKRRTPVLNNNQKAWIGVGVGATAFFVTEYFIYTGDRKGFETALLTGLFFHFTTHVALMHTLK